jgi:hypothetical protein
MSSASEPREIRAESWTHLQELLYEGSWNEELGLFRTDQAFRGRSDASESLATSLMRLGGDDGLEVHLLRNFRKYAASDAVPVDSIWNWLALAQHHGLPTRMLDWTFSPLVALHFATGRLDCMDRDGVVWAVDYPRLHGLAPAVLRGQLEAEGANVVFTTEMLARAAAGLRDFDALSDEEFAIFVEAPSFDERIVNQYALFSLASSPSLALDDYLAQHPELMRRIVVPAELKWEVRDKLDQANITERVLFPGLDGLARWLTRHYLPRR